MLMVMKVMWELYLILFENFKSRAVGSLCEIDIFWLSVYNIVFFVGVDGLYEKKKKVIKVMLLWYFDKFE